MVAHLLELGHRGQHQAAALDSFRCADAVQHVVDHRLIQRGLLRSQVADQIHLQLLGQVSDDRRVGLDAAQDERPGEASQSIRGVVITATLDRLGVALLERRCRSEQPGIGELEDGPQVGEAVFHRRSGDGNPSARRDRADRGGLLGGGVLDRLRFVDDDAPPGDLAEIGGVPRGKCIRGDHKIAAGNPLLKNLRHGPARRHDDVHSQPG